MKLAFSLSIGVALMSLVCCGPQRAEIADFCFLVDVTGSMTQYIEGVKVAIGRIIDEMQSSQIEKLRVAFIGYRDITDKQPFVELGFTENIAAFKQFLATVSAKGGGDTPEDVFGGLEKVPKLGWSPEAGTRVLFHIADSPCHGKKYHNIWGKHPDGDPKGRSINKLIGDIRNKFIDYNFGRISAWKTDKMIGEFSKIYGESIPQLEINPAGSSLTSSRGRGTAVIRGALGKRLEVTTYSKSIGARGGRVGPAGPAGPAPAARVNLNKETGKKIAEASLSALSRSFQRAKGRLSGSS